MSNTTTRRFIVLSQSVNTSEDVFNSLVEVKDKETGEIGTLLCSHMCNWPQELISQATWLEGCKTPEQFKDDSRLALGYHPEQYTQWRVFNETSEIEIYLTGGENSEVEEAWLTTGLTRPNLPFEAGINPTSANFKPILTRLADRIIGRDIYISQDEKQIRLDNLESVLHRLVNSYKVTAWEASVFPSFYFRCKLPSWAEIHWEGKPDVFLGGGLAAFKDGGVYSSSFSLIPYFRDDTGLEVTQNNFSEGFAVATEFNSYYDYRGIKQVIYKDPNEIFVED